MPVLCIQSAYSCSVNSSQSTKAHSLSGVCQVVTPASIILDARLRSCAMAASTVLTASLEQSPSSADRLSDSNASLLSTDHQHFNTPSEPRCQMVLLYYIPLTATQPQSIQSMLAAVRERVLYASTCQLARTRGRRGHYRSGIVRSKTVFHVSRGS